MKTSIRAGSLLVAVMAVLYTSANQRETIDSLNQVLGTVQTDTAKAQVLNKLCRAWWNTDTRKSIETGNKALTIAKETGYDKGVADAHNNIGVAYLIQSEYTKAIRHYGKSLEIRKLMGNERDVADSYVNIGNVHYYLGDNNKAVEYYFESLRIYEKLNLKKDIADACNNIGLFLEAQQDYDRALKYHFRAMRSYKEIGLKKEIAVSYNNIGNIYDKTKRYTEALEYHNKSLLFRKESGDIRGMASSYNNIGLIYQYEGDYEKAMEYLFKSLRLSSELNDKWNMAVSYNTIGKCYNEQKQFEKAVDYLETGLALAMEIGGKEVKKDAYAGLAEAHAGLEDHAQAYRYQGLFIRVKDSLMNEETSRQVAEMEAKYENQQKENEIMLLKKDREIDKLIVYSASGGLVLTLILALVVLRGYRNKQKANRILSGQNRLIEEKNKDIMDSIDYARRIQEALLPTENIFRQLLGEAFVYYKPRDVVSGDFYWVESPLQSGKDNYPGNKKVLFAVSDCTGHGVPGAFMSIVGHSGLNRAVKEYRLSKPSEVLDQLSLAVQETLRQTSADSVVKDGMDIALCSLDRKNKVLEYAGAYNSLYVVRSSKSGVESHNNSRLQTFNSKLTEVRADRQPVGVHNSERRKPFSNHELKLEKGDMVYIFSDGYADQFGGPKGKKFKYQQLKDLLIAISGKPVEEQLRELDFAFESWRNHSEKGPYAQVDDVCVMGVRV